MPSKHPRREWWMNWDGSTNYAPHYHSRAFVVDDFGSLLKVQRCSTCRCWLLENEENFQVRSRKPTGHIETFFSWCRPCLNARRRARTAAESPEEKKAKNRAQYERVRADEEVDGRRRERNRLAQRRYRQTEGYQRTRQRYRDKVKRDPAWRARINESQRMYWRLRQERKGKPLEIAERNTTSGCGPEIPAWPLHLAVRQYVERQPDDVTLEDIGGVLGVSEKTVREWRDGKGRKMVRADVAEKVFIGLDVLWFDVYEKPANGHEPEKLAAWRAACLAFEGELIE